MILTRRRYYRYPVPSGGSGGLQTKPAGEDELPTSECSESAQSSSLGHDNKITPNQSEFALVLQQLNEIKEELCSMREDLETFKVRSQYRNILAYV